MAIKTQPLPYAPNALEPHISAETLEYHHGKHYAGYVGKLNDAVEGTPYADLGLTDIVMRADEPAVFNNAAQAWNHEFYFSGLSPRDTRLSDALADAVTRRFGSFEKLCEAFADAAAARFGSGWAWLVLDPARELDIVTTANAANPLTDGMSPLLTCDVWEHAYYIDYRNDRGAYLEHFMQLANWEFASDNYATAVAGKQAA
ncbi:MAG: superoxide dismutase [Gammaproteobacteria bacterium]